MDVFFTAFALTTGALLPIMNPATSAVLFLGVARGRPAAWGAAAARRVGLFVFATLVVAYFSGALVMELFGISLPGLQLAGGLIVAFIGFRMLFPPAAAPGPSIADEESVAFVPLTIPSLCGPGTLAMALAAATEVERRVAWPERAWVDAGMVAAFGAVALLSWLSMRLAAPIERVLGRSGIDALTRVLGFLLVCIGMQFLIGAGRALGLIA